MESSQWLLNLVTAIAAGVVSAVVTLWVSLTRFRTERWWERKAEAYSDILAHLVDTKQHADMFLRELYGEIRPDEDRKEQARDRAAKARNQLIRVSTMGAFLISDEAIEALDELGRKKNATEKDLVRIVEEDQAGLATAIQKIRKIAKKDLKTGKGWRRFFA